MTDHRTKAVNFGILYGEQAMKNHERRIEATPAEMLARTRLDVKVSEQASRWFAAECQLDDDPPGFRRALIDYHLCELRGVLIEKHGGGPHTPQPFLWTPKRPWWRFWSRDVTK